jgi:hypothetical protein
MAINGIAENTISTISKDLLSNMLILQCAIVDIDIYTQNLKTQHH